MYIPTCLGNHYFFVLKLVISTINYFAIIKKREMSIHLMCLTAVGGLPIFTKNKGNCENLPFSTIASLNGVHMFFKSMGVCMNSTITDDWTLLWKDYEDAITLIVCGQQLSEQKLELLSDLVFNSFKLFVNVEDFQNPINIADRLKREAKQYMPIVERLLDSLHADIFGFTDCILASDNAHLMVKLNEFSILCGSLFCCIVINQKLAVGTEGWWDLDLIERALLITMLNSSNQPQRDIPVYLPKKSSNAAYRFVSVPIAGSGILCVICGADPSYQEIHNISQRIFKNETEIINYLERHILRNFPEIIDINENISKMILLNTIKQKYVFSRNLIPFSSNDNIFINQNDLATVKKYVDQLLETTFKKGKFDSDKESCSIRCYDQHWVSKYQKCFSHCDDNGNIFIAIFTASIPTHAMKLIVQRTFAALIQEKSICW